LQLLIGHRAIALIYLLGMVLMALIIGRCPMLLAAALTALCFDFFFLPPVGNFHISSVEDAIMLAMYVAVALVLGQLTARIRTQEQVERQREQYATAMYRLTQQLVEATGLDELVIRLVRHLEGVFGVRVAVLLPDRSQHSSFRVHSASTYEIAGPEQPIAAWAFEHGKQAGRFTERQPETGALFIPLVTGGTTIGVVGLALGSPPSAQQRALLEGISQQVALALDRHRLREVSANARLLAESERLAKALLNSMSHEIRTPLAAIQGATGNLLEPQEPELSSGQLSMVAEIQQAAERLNGLVGKVLDITRLESGSIKPKLTLCDMQDLVQVTLKEVRKTLAQHNLTVEIAPSLPLVRADFVLLQQALTNLLANAALHTPKGTAIQLTARVRSGDILLAVADRGPGIPAESLPRLFEKFYRAPGAPTGGTGIGLSLVKGFIQAQGGRVTAENRLGGGALFTIRLPVGETVSTDASHERHSCQEDQRVADRR
jgi:two-component system sensor histidine kinase KdpD